MLKTVRRATCISCLPRLCSIVCSLRVFVLVMAPAWAHDMWGSFSPQSESPLCWFASAHLPPRADVRANENFSLLSVQTLFVREHNRYADCLIAQHPDWDDETIFQAARRFVIALHQVRPVGNRGCAGLFALGLCVL